MGISTHLVYKYSFYDIIENKNNEISNNNIYIFHDILKDISLFKIINNKINLPNNIKFNDLKII